MPPRIKRINKTRLYRPAAGDSGAWPWLEPALTRPIRWDLIASQYDQLIKYARLTSAITLVLAWWHVSYRYSRRGGRSPGIRRLRGRRGGAAALIKRRRS